MISRTIVLVLVSIIAVSLLVSYNPIFTSKSISNHGVANESFPLNATISLESSRLIDKILLDPRVQYMIHKYGFQIERRNISIVDVREINGNYEVTLIFGNKTNSGLVLLIKCLVDKGMNLIRITQIAPVVKSVIINDYRLSISKANELISRRTVLERIYYDPRVNKIMNKYEVSFSDFMEAVKSVGLEGNRTSSMLVMQIIIYKIRKNNTTEYVIDKPGMFNVLMEHSSACPIVDIIKIYFYNEDDTINIIGVSVQQGVLDPRCFFGPAISRR